MWAARRGDYIAVDQLIKAGAGLNKSGHNGSTALMYAAQRADPSCARSLLVAGADPTATNHEGWNALHWAVRYQNNGEIVKSLVEAGINVNERDICGSTPLCYSVSNRHIVSAEALLNYGDDIDNIDNEGDTPLYESFLHLANNILQLLLSRGASYTATNSLGQSVLHVAAVFGGLETLRILLAAKLKNIDIKLVTPEGKTALQLAQERIDKPDGFLEKFEELLADIRLRNASVTSEESGRNNSDITAIHKLLHHLKRLHSLRICLISSPTSVLTRVKHLQRRTNRFISRTPSWKSFWIHWAMGVCSAGLFYISWRYWGGVGLG